MICFPCFLLLLTGLKVGRFFYVENVTDNLLIELKSKKNNNIISYLTLFKINGI